MNASAVATHVQIETSCSTKQLIHDHRQVRLEVLGLTTACRGSDVHDYNVARVVPHGHRKVQQHQDEKPEAVRLLLFERAHAISAQNAQQAQVSRREVLRMLKLHLHTRVLLFLRPHACAQQDISTPTHPIQGRALWHVGIAQVLENRRALEQELQCFVEREQRARLAKHTHSVTGGG